MALIHKCDMCGTCFENNLQINVVSFFERNPANPLNLKQANPRLELCDGCFDLLQTITAAFADMNIDDVLKLEFKKENGEED